MANPEHLKALGKGSESWNSFRSSLGDQLPDLSGVDLIKENLRGRNLSKANLSETNLGEADLSEANLGEASLFKANLGGANLSEANLSGANLSKACLSNADLFDANLRGTNLDEAYLSEANLCRAYLSHANLRHANLGEANLSDAISQEANLFKANLSEANLNKAYLSGTNLGEAHLFKANLSGANLSRANLSNCCLQNASLDGATLTGACLWETQRAGWSIKNAICEYVYWDREAWWEDRESKQPARATHYAPGEFERIHSEQTCIELVYPGGVSTFELNTLPALLQYVASLHPGQSLRVKSLEESGGGAKIRISLGDADPETARRIEASLQEAHEAQLHVLRDENLRLQIEKEYIETLLSSGKLFKGVLSVASENKPMVQNFGNISGSFSLVNQTGDDAKTEVHQQSNGSKELIALLEKTMNRIPAIGLDSAEEERFKETSQSAIAELRKPDPDKSRLQAGCQFFKKFAGEVMSKTSGKFADSAGEALSTDLQTLIHGLSHFLPPALLHLR